MTKEFDKHRYGFLDGLRGVAAILVVQRHVSDVFGGEPFQSSYLAVDFFFVLSGFVISHAYGQKLGSGMPLGSFLLRRIIRLYPLFIVRLLLITVIQYRAFALDGPKWAATFLFNALSLPISFLGIPFILGPSWSLFCEALANIMYAPVAASGSNLRVLITISTLGAVGVLFSAWSFGNLDVGWEFATLYGGVARVMFSFFAGAALYSLRSRIPVFGMGAATLCTVALISILCLSTSAGARPYYDVVAVLIVFPIIVAIGSGISLPKQLLPICGFLGASSYPVYVLHLPLAMITLSLATKLFHPDLDGYRLLAIWLFVAIVTIAAWAIDAYIDEPLRFKISQKVLRKNKVAIA